MTEQQKHQQFLISKINTDSGTDISLPYMEQNIYEDVNNV
jgi:hypothetical protein